MLDMFAFSFSRCVSRITFSGPGGAERLPPENSRPAATTSPLQARQCLADLSRQLLIVGFDDRQRPPP